MEVSRLMRKGLTKTLGTKVKGIKAQILIRTTTIITLGIEIKIKEIKGIKIGTKTIEVLLC